MNSLALCAALPFLPPPRPQVYLPFDPADFRRHGPRDYQLDMLLELVWLVQQGYRRILLQLPTGGGKTKLATALLASAGRAQFIVHRKELIEQTSRAFWGGKIPHSFVASGLPMDLDASVLLCGIATLAEQLGVVLPPELVIWDEAHHLNATTWAAVMAAYPDALHIGLTATPQRLDGRGLADHFDVMVLGPSPKDLIRRGFLSDFDYYGPPFDPSAEAALVGDVVEHYLEHARGEPGIVFASSREHSRSLVDAFVGSGVRALHVDGSMSKGERERADAAFKARDADILLNVNLFGEGYDVPGAVYCGIARRTQSLSWMMQMAGRVLRVTYAPGMPIGTDEQRLAAIAQSEKPRAIICDHGGNWQMHGMPDDDRAWTLAGRLKGGGAGGCNDDADPIRQCLACYRVVKSVVKVCPGCGTEFPAQVRNLRQIAGKLSKIEREEARAALAEEKKRAAAKRKDEERACKSEGDFVRLAEQRGYEFPRQWAKRMVAQRAAWKRRAA